MATAMACGGSGGDFAWGHMQRQGWKKGQGLGRKGQGITDALKPKLKFDQSGVGHSMKEEFEFHWWDHVFNSAAQGITVDESKGEVTVEFKTDKSEVSNKKLRRKMQKEIRNKLYANFVKSGTLQGGKYSAEEEKDVTFTEVKDLSKIKTLTDDELVKACGGRTAHKGARHGQKMTAKLARVAESERLYMEQLQAQLKEKETKKQEKELIKNAKKETPIRANETEAKITDISTDAHLETYNLYEESKRKEEKAQRKLERKERKRKAREEEQKEMEARLAPEMETEEAITEIKKKKKKNKDKIETTEPSEPLHKKRKTADSLQADIPTDETEKKKKKKSKKDKKLKEDQS